MTLPPGHSVRPATREDAAAVAKVIASADEADGAPRDTDIEDVEEFWRELDPAKDALVAEDANGRVVGYVDMVRQGTKTHIDGYVHPAARGRGVGAELLRRAEASVRARDGELVLHATVVAGAKASERLLEQNGYRYVRSFFRMRIRLDGRPPQPRWPEGISIRRYVPGEDDRAMHEALDEAFQDHWGHESRQLEEFIRAQAQSEQLVAEASLFALEGEEIAGAVLSKRRFGGGWIQSLGVRRPWRRRGLGLALLQHAFVSLYDLGERSIGLGVDAENTTGATRLYERAGMHVEVRYDTYEKRVPAG